MGDTSPGPASTGHPPQPPGDPAHPAKTRKPRPRNGQRQPKPSGPAQGQAQPGDGSFLLQSAPAPAPDVGSGGAQPGDGAYLTSNSGGVRGRGRGGRGGGRNGGPPRPTANDDSHDPPAARGGRHPRMPRSDAAKRADATHTTAPTTLNPSATSFTPVPLPDLSALSLSPRIPQGSTSRDSSDHEGSRSRNHSGRGKARPAAPGAAALAGPGGMSSRRAAFQASTKVRPPATSGDEGKPRSSAKRPEKRREPEKDDLVSRLTRGLGRRPFLECPICFNAITPHQPIWSCHPPASPPPPELETPNWSQACYTPFHLSCIRDWATRSLAEEIEKARAAGREGEAPEWRCPGCQKRRAEMIAGYSCFCGRVPSPAMNQNMPHGCGEGCARPRVGCEHQCPLTCHPGPCPPCQVALIVPCPSHHTSITVKCAAATSNNAAMSPVCDEICGRPRSCGHKDHTCELLCHFGECAPCEESELVQCYCGEQSKDVTCGWNRDKEKECAGIPESGVETHWKGRFQCARMCNKEYDCGIHHCEETCHPHPLSPQPCPTSPAIITTCPCGQTPLSALPGFPRASCTSRIPTCDLPCPKSRPCGHACPLTCHSGPCPSCHQKVTRPCRCGESVMTVPCAILRERDEQGDGELLCDRVCKALRNCGRHECGRICCPLSWQKSKKRKDEIIENELHACPLTCGKMLSCGLHTCPKADHRGACGRCLQASYDELICHCENTVIYPPVACGTTISCLFPCARDPPACGHPKTPHTCHETPSCPPCPYLTTRPCACGKDLAVKNVRCSASVVSCGQVCGTLLSCGYHTCDKSCHAGECPPCGQVCNKPKRICKHPCTSSCHAPAKCPEHNPCQAIITQSCACGNITSRTSCGASTSNSGRETTVIPCNSECKVKQRNARLADALGIRTEGRGDVEWDVELRAFARPNHAFVKTVEKTLQEFIASARQTMVLPHMPAAKRTFVTQLAEVYHLATELVDQEPNRSVMIKRRVDTRIPNPLLSSVTAPPTSKLGVMGSTAAAKPAWGSSMSASGGAWTKNAGASTGAGGTAASLFKPAAGAATSSPQTPQNATPETSRPATPVAPLLAAVEGSRSGTVVGEVGVVDDNDWDVDA